NGAWRIQLWTNGSPVGKNVKIKRDGLNPANPTIAPSGRFVISNVGRSDAGLDMVGGVARGSDLRVSSNNNATVFDRIAPNVFEASAPDSTTAVPPAANIDLVQDRDFGTSNDNATFTLTDTAGQTLIPDVRGGLLYAGGPPGPTVTYSIVLQRRANLNR